MIGNSDRRFFTILVLVISSLTIFQPSAGAETVRKGDKVRVHFTCTLPQGGVILTTRKAVAESRSIKKAAVFFFNDEYGPVDMVAGSGYGGPSWGYLISLQNQATAEISEKIPGMELGRAQTFRISTQALSELQPEQGYIELAREVIEPRLQIRPFDYFEGYFGYVPKEGEVLSLSGDMTIEVRKVDSQNRAVSVYLDFEDGANVVTKFGKATLKGKNKDYYAKRFHPKVGHLVGVGACLARISEVKAETFVLDFTHPFGGRELICETCVESIAGKYDGEVD